MLVKLTKRQPSWETSSVEELFAAEFTTKAAQPDLELSVYEIEEHELARTVVEHMANSNCDPKPKVDDHFDLAPLILVHDVVVEASPDSPWFEHLRDRHRVLRFRNVAHLQNFVADVLAMRGRCRISLARADVKRVAAELVSESNPEWDRFCREAPKGAKWAALRR